MIKLGSTLGAPPSRPETVASGSAGERRASYGDGALCLDCSNVGFLISKEGERAVARVCGCRLKCARCRGARYTLVEEGGYTVALSCECSGLFSRVQLFNEARIPAGYAHKKLSLEGTHDKDLAKQRGLLLDYDGFYDRKNASLRHALARVREYERAFTDEQRRGLVLIGGFGLGKTHLVCGLVAGLTLRQGVSCRFVDYHELTARIRGTFDGNGEESESSIIEPLIATQVLVIDDIGKAQASAWALSVLDQIITRRYNARRIILGTTNYTPEAERDPDLPRSDRKRRDLAESLEERIGERLVSRLRATCDFIVLDGKDYRVEGPREAR